jgi:hypothetical protein
MLKKKLKEILGSRSLAATRARESGGPVLTVNATVNQLAISTSATAGNWFACREGSECDARPFFYRGGVLFDRGWTWVEGKDHRLCCVDLMLELLIDAPPDKKPPQEEPEAEWGVSFRPLWGGLQGTRAFFRCLKAKKTPRVQPRG